MGKSISEDDGLNTKTHGDNRGFFATLAQDLARDSLKFLVRSLVAFAVGTGAGGIVCLIYGAPLIFSLAGGVLVLGVMLFLSTAHLF